MAKSLKQPKLKTSPTPVEPKQVAQNGGQHAFEVLVGLLPGAHKADNAVKGHIAKVRAALTAVEEVAND